MKLMNILYWFDQKIVDGLVNAAGWFGRMVAFIHGLSDKYFVDGLVNLVGDGVIGGGAIGMEMAPCRPKAAWAIWKPSVNLAGKTASVPPSKRAVGDYMPFWGW